MTDLKLLIIQWTNKFPLDRWFRKKYNIPFNCDKHRESNPIDIYFEFLEDKIFIDYEEELKEKDEKELMFKNGKWLSDRSSSKSTKKELETFKSIPLEAFQNMTIEDNAKN